MSTIHFDKMQGSGNDFIMVDNREGLVAHTHKPAFAQRFCPRARAVGADGVIFLENDDELDFAWSFWNADGSEAEMCGNGARCMALFALKVGAAGESMCFRTIAGPIHATIVPAGARVRMTDATLPKHIPGLEADGDTWNVYFLNTGVPHVVSPVDDLETVDVRRVGHALRFHEAFHPAGTNVNFMSQAGPDLMAMRTYERGVEDETLACGTGAVACAIVASQLHGLSSPVSLRTRSGTVLTISFSIQGESVTDIHLEGPAECVYEGRLEWSP